MVRMNRDRMLTVPRYMVCALPPMVLAQPNAPFAWLAVFPGQSAVVMPGGAAVNRWHSRFLRDMRG